MAKLTPMMAQYRKIKEQYSDCILMFRLGDFYEMFFEDAVTASEILQITLTSRNKGAANKAPMCGVPYHAVNNYLSKLTKAGKKVALCDQVTEPDGKGIVEREVIRVVTPGTTFDENILDHKANNYVAASLNKGDEFAIAFADVTTGEFRVSQFSDKKDFAAEFVRINPAECICDDDLMSFLNNNNTRTHFFPYKYNGDAKSFLKKHFEIKSLAIFGLEGKKTATQAAGMLLEYLKETQKTDLKHVRTIKYYKVSEFMPLDESCIRNLELFYTNRDNKKEGSLINVLDQTVSAMGGRLIRKWLMHPLLDKAMIENRLNKVEIFVNDSGLMRNMREVLKNIYDIERLLSRLSMGTGNARDLVAMKLSLKIIPEIKNLVEGRGALKDLPGNLNPLPKLVELIEKAILDEPPVSVRDGGIIKDGFDQQLDELRLISREGKTFIKKLQEREVNRTGVSSLKVKFNKVFGYYIEISKANLSSVPDDYIRKQTLVNAERFITPELKEYEDKVLNAEEKIKELEYELFYKVRMEVIKEIVSIQKIARSIAFLDVISSFAFIAERNNYCKPEIVEGMGFEIKEGRHPVIEQMNVNADFIPNDCNFNENERFLLITGPNMGGKSTYLRQVALICLMAQIGCYVPALSARLSLVDRIFTRVGASDNLARGESTFMVEMQEASFILNQATKNSLIILDEIGRGTSTYDGVSIAWAITEYIHDHTGAKTLFATHYHELIELVDRLKNAKNLSAAVRENENEGVVFLYKIEEGGVDKSYGIEVAKLAGLPREIISRARGVLDQLETKHIRRNRINTDQMGLFKGDSEERHHKKINVERDRIFEEIDKIDINKLTPLEAMQKLDAIKKKSSEKKSDR